MNQRDPFESNLETALAELETSAPTGTVPRLPATSARARRLLLLPTGVTLLVGVLIGALGTQLLTGVRPSGTAVPSLHSPEGSPTPMPTEDLPVVSFDAKAVGDGAYLNAIALAQHRNRTVLVGQSTKSPVLTSTDAGVTWTSAPLPSGVPSAFSMGASLHDIADGPYGLVAVGAYNAIDFGTPTIWYSADGATWSIANQPWARGDASFPLGSVDAVAAGADGYVAIGGVGDEAAPSQPSFKAVIWASADGRTWHAVTLADASGLALHDVAYGDGIFVAVGTRDGNRPELLASADGEHWSVPANPPDNRSQGLDHVVFGHGRWLVRGNDLGDPTPEQSGRAMIWTSLDSRSWTLAARWDDFNGPSRLAVATEGFIGTRGAPYALKGADPRPMILTSTDGARWSAPRVIHNGPGWADSALEVSGRLLITGGTGLTGAESVTATVFAHAWPLTQ